MTDATPNLRYVVGYTLTAPTHRKDNADGDVEGAAFYFCGIRGDKVDATGFVDDALRYISEAQAQRTTDHLNKFYGRAKPTNSGPFTVMVYEAELASARVSGRPLTLVDAMLDEFPKV